MLRQFFFLTFADEYITIRLIIINLIMVNRELLIAYEDMEWDERKCIEEGSAAYED